MSWPSGLVPLPIAVLVNVPAVGNTLVHWNCHDSPGSSTLSLSMSPMLNPAESIGVTGEHWLSVTETFVSGWLPSLVSVYVNVTDWPVKMLVALAVLFSMVDDIGVITV